MRIRPSQVVVSVAAVALPLALHPAGHKRHHVSRTSPAHARKTHAKPSTGTGNSQQSTTTGTGNGQQSTTHSAGTSRPSHPVAGRARRARHHHFRVPLGVKAHSAKDPGVGIADFSFSPGSLTIHAGDTVTWTNSGPSKHTATGSGFDTGTLATGASASHTFTSAGTFSYICSIHPFMHGTIVVLASTTTSTPSTTPGTTTTPTATTSTGSGLPNTGLDLVATILVGLVLGGAGLLLRRPARGLPQSESGEDHSSGR